MTDGPTAAEIRQRQGHPTIDADGHILEYRKIVLDYLEGLFGAQMRAEYQAWDEQARRFQWDHATPADRMAWRMGRPQFWATAGANTLDRATAALPNLRRARMDELGIDFAILYPSAGLIYVNLPHDTFRPALCRAYNTMVADLYRDHADRMTPVAIIPTHTPEEALAELDHAIGTLGLKSIALANFVLRTPDGMKDADPRVARAAQYCDMLALDSPYDYDPVWARCVELGVAVTAHNTTFGLGFRRAVNNFMFNHLGHFAAGGEMFAKALFFGGVTARFPGLNFGFMEGGVSWGGVLFSGLRERWLKRNAEGVHYFDSRNVDTQEMASLFRQYSDGVIADHITEADGFDPPPRDVGMGEQDRLDPKLVDEFHACGMTRIEDLVDRFQKPFFFGCEADEPYAGAALRGEGMPFSLPVKALFSSDIGHWDVTDARHVAVEAYEQLEDGLMTEAQYRDFMYGNTVRLHGGMNPDFFRGTVLETDAAAILEAG